MNSDNYEKPQLILKINTKIKGPYILLLNEDRLCLSSLEENARIYNKYTYKVDIINIRRSFIRLSYTTIK